MHWNIRLKPGFHTCASRTHNSARCLEMYGHQWSQAIAAFATKACELATKPHMLNFCEGLCRDMLWLCSIETNNARKKKFPVLQKTRAKPKITTTFGKSVFLINSWRLMTTFRKSLFLIKYRMRYAIYMPPNTKDLAINHTMVAYGNRQNATAFARANNSDLLRSLKHLIETRLKCEHRTLKMRLLWKRL